MEQNEKLKKILNEVQKQINESEKYLTQFGKELGMDEKDILRLDDKECDASYELGFRDGLAVAMVLIKKVN